MESSREGYHQYELDNGLVVALKKTSSLRVASLLTTNFGTIHERSGEEGLAHFLEHCLCAGGSGKFPLSEAKSVKELFPYSNAQTTIGRTVFKGGVLQEGVEGWFDYISNQVFNPAFEEEVIDQEKGVILREISDNKSNPFQIQNKGFKEAFFRDHPKGLSVLGQEEVVKTANRDLLKRFHSRGYVSNNMDLIVAGNLPSNIEELVENYFGKYLPGNDSRVEFPLPLPFNGKKIMHFSGPEGINQEHPLESSATVSLSYLAPEDLNEDEYAFVALNSILGGNSGSRLFENVRNKNGLAYHVSTSYDGSYNFGAGSVDAAVPSLRIDEAVRTIFEEMSRFKSEEVSDRELQRFKRNLTYDFASGQESLERFLSSVRIYLDEGIDFQERFKRLDAVTPERIMEVARKYFPNREDGGYVLTIRDPLRDHPIYGSQAITID